MSTNPSSKFNVEAFLAEIPKAQRAALEAHIAAKGRRNLIRIGGKTYEVSPAKEIAVIQMTITATADGSRIFEAAHDCLVRHIQCYVEDSGGLSACRIGWTSDSGQNTDFYAADKDATIIYPVASTILTDANTAKAARDPWNLRFEKGRARKFIAQNVNGTAPYNVELTMELQRLVKVG